MFKGHTPPVKGKRQNKREGSLLTEPIESLSTQCRALTWVSRGKAFSKEQGVQGCWPASSWPTVHCLQLGVWYHHPIKIR